MGEPRVKTGAIKDRSSSLARAFGLAALATLVRVVYLRFACDYHLVEDEAHYWLWSRHLDWSYYSKGPGVALVIAATTRIFGDIEWAVRLGTALLSGAGLVFSALLGRDLAMHALGGGIASGRGDDRVPRATPASVACTSVLSMLLAPALQAVGVLMTIDGPYVACWSAACWCAWRALMGRSSAAWLGLGLALAMGFLFKYTMLLVVPGIAVFALIQRSELTLAPRWRAWLGAGVVIAACGLAPVLIWNAQLGWPTFKHLLGHLGLKGGDMPIASGTSGGTDEWSPWWSLELIGQQIGMIGPLLLLAGLGAWGLLRRGADRHDSRRPARLFLLAVAAPILVFYLCVSLVAEPEGNWPMAAYATLLPLAAWIGADARVRARAARARAERPDRPTLWERRLWRAGLWYGAIAALLLHFAGDVGGALNSLSDRSWFRAGFSAIAGREPRDIALGRLYGAPQMAANVDALLDDLRRQGSSGEPFVLTQHYGRASQLAFYLRHAHRGDLGVANDRTDVLSAMHETGGRRSQFDLWAFASLDRPDLLGRSAVILSNNRPEVVAVWRAMFDSIEPIPGERLAGEHKRDRVAYIGRGYRGTKHLPGAPAPSRKDAP